MRAWLAILKERHPEVMWITRDDEPLEEPAIAPTEPAEPVTA